MIVAGLVVATLVLEGNPGKKIPPAILRGKGAVPEFFRRGELRNFSFSPSVHVDFIKALAIAGIGKAQTKHPAILLGLSDTFGQGFIPCLGLQNGQLAVAIDQYIISNQGSTPFTMAFDPAQGDGVFPEDTTAFYHSPAGCFEGGINVFRPCLGFVHFVVIGFR